MIEYLGSQIAARRANDGHDLFTQLCKTTTDDGALLTPQEVLDHMNFVMMAAHDTLASSLTSFVYSDIPQMAVGSTRNPPRPMVFGKPAPSPPALDRGQDTPSGCLAGKILNLPSSRRTFPVVFDQTRDTQTHYAGDVIGGGRNSAISRKMSANRFLGMATSDIWKAT
jgi:hypothetical protein